MGISDEIELAAWEHEVRGAGGRWESGRMRVDQLPDFRDHLADRQYSQAEAVESIRKHGVQEPIAIMHDPDGALVVNGRHRLAYAREAGVADVPVIVQHAEGTNPRSLPIRGRRPATYAEFYRAWQAKPPRTIQATSTVTSQIELGYDPAEPRDKAGRWFHGTSFVHQPGEVISPKGGFDRMFIIPSQAAASHYARMQAIARYDEGEHSARPHIYEVEPVGPVTNEEPAHQGSSAKQLRIVREVPFKTRPGGYAYPPPWERQADLACPGCGCLTEQIELADAWKTEARGPGGEWVLSSLNPTGTLFTDYNPQARATAPLGPNMTTLAETQGVHPDTPLRIYRGAPAGQKGIAPGDFITDNPQLAKDYAGSGKVLSLDATYGDVLDDRTEPGGGEYIYGPRRKVSPQT